jgi:hypothetical protein
MKTTALALTLIAPATAQVPDQLKHAVFGVQRDAHPGTSVAVNGGYTVAA